MNETDLLYPVGSMQRVLAEKLGQIINPNMPIGIEISEICNNSYAEPGETYWTPNAEDTDSDEIYTWDSTNGVVQVVKRSPVGFTALNFTGLQTKEEQVLYTDMMIGKDQSLFTRKTAHLIAAADKQELRAVVNLVNASGAVQTVAKATADDILVVARNMKQKLSKYGTEFVWLVGSDVHDAIEAYDQAMAGTNNYNLMLEERLAKWGIKVIKVLDTSTVKSTGDVSDQPVLAAKRSIMVANRSPLAIGKPIDFIRGKVSPEIAALMGGKVLENYRSLLILPATRSSAGAVIAGFSVFVIEKIGLAIVNPHAICKNTNDIVA